VGVAFGSCGYGLAETLVAAPQMDWLKTPFAGGDGACENAVTAMDALPVKEVEM
jgi:hypothetical protein